MTPWSTKLNQVLFQPHSRVGTNLDSWFAGIGGKGLRRALKNPSELIPTIREADLRGLGGSGFPTHKKWGYVAAQQDAEAKYLICNGNEDEPGTFKDRILLKD